MVCCESWGRPLFGWEGMGLTKLSPHNLGKEEREKKWRLFILVHTEMPGCAGVLVGEDGTDGANQSREAVGLQLLTNPLEQPYPHYHWHTSLEVETEKPRHMSRSSLPGNLFSVAAVEHTS